MAHTLPSFEQDEVALLISAVEKSLERLYAANERVGGNDAELLESPAATPSFCRSSSPYSNSSCRRVPSPSQAPLHSRDGRRLPSRTC